MDFAVKVKSMLKEAELYRSQGLLEEALRQYEKASEAIGGNNRIKNRDSLMNKISRRIESVRHEIDKFDHVGDPPEVSEEARQLMREMFSLDDPEVKGSAALGGAISLAEFGQHNEAIEEFENLLESDKLRMDAAKNILKYSFICRETEEIISVFKGWASDQRFTQQEIDSLGGYLQELIDMSGIDVDITERLAEGDIEPESEVDADDILDISAIRLPLTKGAMKGNNSELDVNFQQCNQINLIISQNEKGIYESLDKGDVINSVTFYSPVAIFSGTVYVVSKEPISAGPKRGDTSVNLKIIRIEAG